MGDREDKQVAIAKALAARGDYVFDDTDTVRPVDGGVSGDVAAFSYRAPDKRDDETDEEYRVRDDLGWRATKRRAEAAGKSARRLDTAGELWSKLTDGDIGGAVSGAAEQLAHQAGSGAQAVLNSLDILNARVPSAVAQATVGGDRDLRADLQRGAEENPVAAVGSGLLSALDPRSVMGQLGRAGRKVVQAVPAGAGRAVGAAAGGATAAAEAEAANLVARGADAAADREHEPVADPMVAGALGGVAGGARGARGALRAPRTDADLPAPVNVIEAGGGRTSVLRGLEPGERMKRALAEARRDGVDPSEVIQRMYRDESRALRALAKARGEKASEAGASEAMEAARLRKAQLMAQLKVLRAMNPADRRQFGMLGAVPGMGKVRKALVGSQPSSGPSAAAYHADPIMGLLARLYGLSLPAAAAAEATSEEQ